MAFVVYLFVLVIVGGAALFGLDVVTAPLPEHRPVAPLLSAQSDASKAAKQVARKEQTDAAANKALSPVFPTSPGVSHEEAAAKAEAADASETTGAASNTETATNEPATDNVASTAPNGVASTANAAAPPARPVAAATSQIDPQAAAAGHCDVDACAAAYRSFRAADCTYQPYGGPRRACVAPPMRQAQRAMTAQPRARGYVEPDSDYDDAYAADDDYDDAEDMPPPPRRGSIVVIRRPFWFR